MNETTVELLEPPAVRSLESTQPVGGAILPFRLCHATELLDLPPPDWLIEGLIQQGAQGVVYGPSGHGKTFVVLDWALSVATGRSWNGRPIAKGPVVYIATEGGRNMGTRIAAWMRESGLTDLGSAFFLLEAVQLRKGSDVQRLVASITDLCVRPVLIVFDTLAKCFVGGEENNAAEMGELVASVAHLQSQTAAAVLLVHHTGKDGGAERGSSALRAAADVMFKVSRGKDGLITIENDKQKDEEEFPEIKMALKRIDLPERANGGRVTSGVLVAAANLKGNAPSVGLSLREQSAFDILAGAGRSLTSGEWYGLVRSKSQEQLPARTFQHWRRALLEKGAVERDPETGLYQPKDNGVPFANGMPLAKESAGAFVCASHATTPVGVAGRHTHSISVREPFLRGWKEYELRTAALRGGL